MRPIGILITFLLVSIENYTISSIGFTESPKYLISNFIQNFLVKFDYSFDLINYNALTSNFTTEIDPLTFIYLYVALIGFYIAIVLNFNKKVEFTAKILISAFIFIHSIFILHIFLLLTKYQLQYPHTYRISTIFSLLYGPLLYLYFKRITTQQKFKKIDLLHFLPTLIFAIYLLPGYMLSADQKLEILLGRENIGRNFSDVAIIVVKAIFLIGYGYYIRKLYLTTKKDTTVQSGNKRWQKNIYLIHVLYVSCYLAYGILLGNNITSGFLFHMQVVCMAIMVMYIGYCANVQPVVFNRKAPINGLFFKYKKSGLTQSLSHELKENLIHLFNTEKIYKESNICLDTLSTKLNTTRHNASQVINEHFDMSFHELVNSYRIKEAKELLNSDMQKNLNIIDVAYEVGYNNKVTFNKAFKKDTQLTPSQYQKITVT
jgi:AraC-like DNA-binding protein